MRYVTHRAVLLILAILRGAGAAEASDDEVGGDGEEPGLRRFRPSLDAPSDLAAGLEAYGGLAFLWTKGTDQSRAVAGGLVRARWRYLQLGGVVETSNSGEATGLYEREQERWFAAGGFAGVLLPFRRWIDVDAAVGLVSRKYESSSSIYGTRGFAVAGPSITWRIGISDRTTERLVGVRVGGGFMGAVDLVTHAPEWRMEYVRRGELADVRGTTPVGGASVALFVAAGFEVGGGSR